MESSKNTEPSFCCKICNVHVKRSNRKHKSPGELLLFGYYKFETNYEKNIDSESERYWTFNFYFERKTS